MAKEEIKEKEVIETVKTEEVTQHKVLVPFTLDKPLFPGNKIFLPAGKIKDTLIFNKLIK